MILSKPFESYKIDSLSKRWAAVLLLLFAWGVSFYILLSPPGDPDFSQVMYWYEDMFKADSFTDYYSAHPFTDVFTTANLVYLMAFCAYLALMHLLGFFYFVLFTCDKRNISLKKAPSIYFSRIWWLILFSTVICVPSLLVLSYLPYVVIFLLPACYAIPGLVFFEKRDPFTSIVESFRKTHGHKLSIFAELTVVSMIYTVIHFVIYKILNDGSIGQSLVESFLRAYLILVIFRNLGLRYHMITVLDRN